MNYNITPVRRILLSVGSVLWLVLNFGMREMVYAQEEGAVLKPYTEAQDMQDTPFYVTLGDFSVDVTLKDFKEENSTANTLHADRIFDIAPQLKRYAADARLTYEGKKGFEITPSAAGIHIDIKKLQDELASMNEQGVIHDVSLDFHMAPPKVTAEDMAVVLPRMEEIIKKKIILTPKIVDGSTVIINDKEYVFNVAERFEVLKPSLTQYLQLGDMRIPVSLIAEDSRAMELLKKDWVIDLNAQKYETYINEILAPELEAPSQDVTVSYDAAGKIIFEGTAQNGVRIDRGELKDNMKAVLNQSEADVAASVASGINVSSAAKLAVVPLKEVKGKVNVPDDLRARGVTDLFSVGYSNFAGSSSKRIVNIKTGIAKYNGLIIPKGEVFSFNDNLGPVDAANGYVEELVIKGDQTIPEFGGGICQVSSTFFRAGLFGGLPIPERKAHSYAVQYYARPGGHGLDCTIYPGVTDCKIRNDTGGDLLIQAYTDGLDMYFKFYGTPDNRKIVLDGPYYSNQVGAPSDKVIYNSSKAAGYYEVKDQPHNGFDAVWYRTVTLADGNEVKETFKSRYQARPRVIIKGGEKPVESAPAKQDKTEMDGFSS